MSFHPPPLFRMSFRSVSDHSSPPFPYVPHSPLSIYLELLQSHRSFDFSKHCLQRSTVTWHCSHHQMCVYTSTWNLFSAEAMLFPDILSRSTFSILSWRLWSLKNNKKLILIHSLWTKDMITLRMYFTFCFFFFRFPRSQFTFCALGWIHCSAFFRGQTRWCLFSFGNREREQSKTLYPSITDGGKSMSTSSFTSDKWPRRTVAK